MRGILVTIWKCFELQKVLNDSTDQYQFKTQSCLESTEKQRNSIMNKRLPFPSWLDAHWVCFFLHPSTVVSSAFCVYLSSSSSSASASSSSNVSFYNQSLWHLYQGSILPQYSGLPLDHNCPSRLLFCLKTSTALLHLGTSDNLMVPEGKVI